MLFLNFLAFCVIEHSIEAIVEAIGGRGGQRGGIFGVPDL